MTSLSPEMLGRYSATQLPDFIAHMSRKLLHPLSFCTGPVYHFCPWEAVSKGLAHSITTQEV